MIEDWRAVTRKGVACHGGQLYVMHAIAQTCCHCCAHGSRTCDGILIVR